MYTQFALSIYLAWISIATIANISATLVGYRWNGGGIAPAYWTIILIGIASLISLYVILIKRNVFFGLIVIWALYGIVLKRTAVDAIVYANVINAAWTAIAIILFAMVVQLIKSFRIKKQSRIFISKSR